jgi:cyclopropane-fatty-acyl-phospholipid synthase
VRTASWMKASDTLLLNICGQGGFACTCAARDESDWMGRYFLTGDIIPGEHRRVYFQRDVRLLERGRAALASHYLFETR